MSSVLATCWAAPSLSSATTSSSSTGRACGPTTRRARRRSRAACCRCGGGVRVCVEGRGRGAAGQGCERLRGCHQRWRPPPLPAAPPRLLARAQGVRATVTSLLACFVYLSYEKVWSFHIFATPWYASRPLLQRLCVMQVRALLSVMGAQAGRARAPLSPLDHLCWCLGAARGHAMPRQPHHLWRGADGLKERAPAAAPPAAHSPAAAGGCAGSRRAAHCSPCPLPRPRPARRRSTPGRRHRVPLAVLLCLEQRLGEPRVCRL